MRTIHFNTLRLRRAVLACLAGAACAIAVGITPHAAADEPLPPMIPPIIYDVHQFLDPPFIFQLPHEDPNPGGTGSPHTFMIIEAPGPVFGTFYQIEEDGETFGEEILGFNVPVTNPDGLVGFIEAPWSLFDTPYHFSVTNAHGLTTQASLYLNIIEINHAPVAVSSSAAAYEDDPVISLPISMTDANGDDLTFTITALPEHGDVYAHSVDPANLITAPGATFPEETPIFWDAGLEIDKSAPAGPVFTTTFEFFASDYEFDSDIATITLQGLRRHWPSEYELTPSSVESIHNQPAEYIEISIELDPYEDVAGHIFMESIPAVGEVCFDIPTGDGGTIPACFTELNVPEVHIPTLPGDVAEDGSSVTRVRYSPPQADIEPTTPGDPSMEIDFRVQSWIGQSQNEYEWHYNLSITVPVTLLPGSCSPDFAPEEYCHSSCTSAMPCEGQPLCDPLPGASLYFDGAERFVNLGEFDEFRDTLNHGTVEAWFRTDHTDSRTTLMRSIGKSPFPGIPDLDFPYHFAINFNTVFPSGGGEGHEPGHIHVRRRFLGDRSYVYEAMDVFDNHWHHLALRIDAETELVELYIDGVLREPVSVFVEGNEPLVFGSSDYPLNLGALEANNGGLDHFFVGQIDEVRFWDYLRTVEQINDAMDHAAEQFTPGLLGYFPLDEATGTTTANLGNAPNAADAALINTPSWIDAHVCDPAPGIPGDLNGDGIVNGADLLILLSAWGECADPDDCPADLNGAGFVDGADLLILLSNWG